MLLGVHLTSLTGGRGREGYMPVFWENKPSWQIFSIYKVYVEMPPTTSTATPMAGETIIGRAKKAIKGIQESDQPVVAFAREILWVVAVVAGIALLLFLVCGTWPAVVAVESESMLPNMHVNDLVFVVEKDRFGELQTYETGGNSGYMKFGNYGDVVIYRPNGANGIHPIIHRAMAYHDASWFAEHLGREFSHGGYMTKGDNNKVPDQQTTIAGIGPIQPVEDGWIVGKALFSVPLLGYPTLHYPEFAAIVIILLIIHEVYVSRREGEEEKGKKKRRR
jgi:signal peptidase